jgi:Acetyltransferase (GNAT) domain
VAVSATQRAAVTVRVIDSLGEIEEIRSAWSAWRGHRDADIDVYRTLLACRPDSAKPYILVVERDGQPDAILIGTASTAVLSERIGYWTIPVPEVRVLSFQYGGFLGNQSEENSNLIINELAQSLRRGEGDVAVLSYTRQASSIYNAALTAPALLMRDHFPLNETHSMMNLSGTPEEIYRGLPAKHRGNLRRDGKKFRAAFADDVYIRRFERTDQLDELIEIAERIATTTYQRGLGVGFSKTRFVQELLTLEAAKGWLRGFVLSAGRQPCAFLIGNVYSNTFLSEYFGHDPTYSKHSPGMYLLMHAIEELCRDGVAAIDFGIGKAFYKERFANSHWNESTIYMYAPTWTGMRVKALRTMALLINSVGKRLLERAHVADKIKKIWRHRVAHSQPPERG